VREGVLSANPVLFAEGVPNAAAAHVSTNFGIRGACQTFIGSRTGGLDALAMAARRIGTGACDIVVVGAAEETHATVDRAYRHFLGNELLHIARFGRVDHRVRSARAGTRGTSACENGSEFERLR
jgi:acetyl-CoA acetyltransferase